MVTYPETFEIIEKNNITLFHGTNSNALLSILKYGMNSVDESSKMGITVSTGEEWTRAGGKRKFISFTDDLDIALDYASIKPSKDESKENSFSVLIGMSSNDVKSMRTYPVQSDLPEVGIMDNVPLEYIKLIAVPENKVEFVRKLVNNDKIAVAAIDTDEKFYYMDEVSGEINFNDEKAKELIEARKQPEQNTTFDSKAIRKLAEGRKISGILDMYRKMKEKIKEKINGRGKENETNSRDK